MNRAGFSWRQSTVAKTEAAARPVRVDEAAALAGILGVTVDDLVRPELHPLTARIQLARGALAEADRELLQRERERQTAEWRRDEARERLEALQELARAAFDEPSRDGWVVAMMRLMEVFDRPEHQAILQDVGISAEALNAAVVEATNSEPSGTEERVITVQVAERLPMPTKIEG
jgi:transcriptional regulator with XRE-family HTH domain